MERWYAVLSDIHGNLAALEAVARHAHKLCAAHNAEPAFVCLGDVVDLGPQPNECVAWVAAHAERVVHGNHDMAALGDQFPIDIQPDWVPMLLWTRRALSRASRRVMQEWPDRLLPDGDLADFVLFHSSLAQYNEYVNNGEAARASLRQQQPRRYGLFGHTHLQSTYQYDPTSDRVTMGLVMPKRMVIPIDGVLPLPIGQWYAAPDGDQPVMFNPGSVGQPRVHALLASYGVPLDYYASYMLLRRDQRHRWRFRFEHVRYDANITINLLRTKVRWKRQPATSAAISQHPFARDLAEIYHTMPTGLPRTVEILVRHLKPPVDGNQ